MLKTKTDYYGLATSGWEVQSNNENRSVGTAEAKGSDGFVVAITTFGEKVAPDCDYIATASAALDGIVIGGVHTVGEKKIALGSVSVKTSAGTAPSMTASGSQIEDGGSAHCTCTISGISIDSLFHAQDFGLFTYTGQLTDCTLTINGDVATAEIDGVIKSSDLTNCSVTVSGTIIGVDSTGQIVAATVTPKTLNGATGVTTQPPSLSNPNGDYPSYSFSIQWALKADSNG